MPTREKRPERSPAPTSRRRSLAAALLLALAAAVLTALASVQLRALWLRLPVPQLEALDRATIRKAFSAARAGMRAEPRGAEVLAAISERFPAALRDANQVPAFLDEARGVVGQVRRSQVGRLQLAALTLLRLEHERAAPETWWPSVQPYLEGLDGATFEHFLPELLDAQTAVYAELGLEPGFARRSAQRSVGCPHATFLQVFVDRMEHLAAAERRSGRAASAALCRRLVQRILRQWTLDPGPPELRMLAADLLAEVFTRDSPASATGSVTDLAQSLRIWRSGCKTWLGALWPPAPLLGIGHEGDLCPRESETLVHGLAACTWLASATAAAALGAIALFAAWIFARPPVQRRRLVWATGATVALALIACGLLWPLVLPDSVTHDFRRMGSNIGWPYHPLLAGALTWVLLGVTVLLPPSNEHAPRRRVGGLARPAVVAWLVLAGATLAACTLAERSRGVYETRLATALTAAQTVVPAEPGNDTWLDGLRAWTPGGE